MRYPQYSLKSLLVFTSVLVVVLGLAADRRWKQREAIRQIESFGCIVVPQPSNVSWLIGLRNPFYQRLFVRCPATIDDERFAQLVPHLAAAHWVVILVFDGARIGDHSMQALSRLTSLETLSVAGTSVTDAGVARLVDVAKLAAIDLSHTATTDRSVPFLLRLPHLRWLKFEGTCISPEGFDQLKRAKPGLNFPAMN